MLIKCTTRGCFAETEAKLDVKNDTVICESCGNVIERITPYIKRALKDSGQILRNKQIKPFQSYCLACKVNKSLYLDGGRAFCKDCGSQVHISAAFANGLKEHLADLEKEEKKDKLEETAETKEVKKVGRPRKEKPSDI
jgi:hypothetical protein